MKCLAAVLLAVALADACVRTAPAPSLSDTDWVTSDSSRYSPVLRARATYHLTADRLEIRIDTGQVTLPGTASVDAPPLMSQLYITALVATIDSSSRTRVTANAKGRHADLRGWRPVANSDSVLLAKELRYGERRVIRNLRIVVTDMPATNPSQLWVVFRISGNAVEVRAPAEAGGPILRRDIPNGVTVYACGPRNVQGQLDERRMEQLRRAYGVAC